MFDFLLDTANLQSDYTLYTGIFLGSLFNFLWVWNIDYRFVHSIYSSSDVHVEATCPLLQMERHKCIAIFALLWIIKYIRRKENPSDEPRSFYFLNISS